MKLTYTKTLKQRKAKAAHYKVMMGKAVSIGNMNMLRKYADMYEACQKGTHAYEKQHWATLLAEQAAHEEQPISYTKHGHMVFHPPALQSRKKVA